MKNIKGESKGKHTRKEGITMQKFFALFVTAAMLTAFAFVAKGLGQN
jgi:hypothetical protein